jgi:hypothetical protein
MNKPIADETPTHSIFYLITLCSTSLPMPLEVPFALRKMHAQSWPPLTSIV